MATHTLFAPSYKREKPEPQKQFNLSEKMGFFFTQLLPNTMYYIHVQDLHKHGADGHDYYLKSNQQFADDALYDAEQYVCKMMLYGYTIVEDNTVIEEEPGLGLDETDYLPV